MADVLPSCIGIEGLLYLIFSGFVQANKSHRGKSFQRIHINPSGGPSGAEGQLSVSTEGFQRIRINPSGGGVEVELEYWENEKDRLFPMSPH